MTGLKRIFLLILTFSLVGLAGCTGESQQKENQSEITTGGADKVTRFVDEEAGVVCWKFSVRRGTSSGGAGGLSCLPLNETDLSE